tara:strand:+ start:42177 stop:43010 length:834 start_codon:yes stop_codon:yes gene_type:complete
VFSRNIKIVDVSFSLDFYEKPNMKFHHNCIGLALVIVAIISCDSSSNKSENTSDQQVTDSIASVEETVENIVFKQLQAEMNPDAMLDIYNPIGNENFKEGKVSFSFNIRNHGLGKENPLMLSINGASPKPYSMPNFLMDLNKGTYRAVAFLLNEQGLALKEYGNFSSRDFTVGDSRPFPEDDVPYLVLHLPGEQQTYAPAETVVVDFLYLGGGPANDGVKVKIEIDGQEYFTQEIAPVELSKLPKGPHSLKISLVSAANDQEISGVFASETRNITIN